MLFVKAKKSEGERTRIKLAEAEALDTGYKIEGGRAYIYLPVKRKVEGFTVVERDGERIERKRPKNMREALAGVMSQDEIDRLGTSFDIIGDIAIAEVKDGPADKEKKIAEAIMAVHPGVKVVAKKLGGMEGEFRVRPLKVITGENRTETVYKENGCLMKLDVATVYFSVRLSHERLRIAGLVKPGEKILALFAGVGPFPLVIAKRKPDTKIIAVELNPDGVRYMRENIRLNKCEKTVEAVEGDAREVVLRSYRNFADRILMTLPKSADKFLDVAFAGAKDGCVVHVYGFAAEEKAYSELEEKIAAAAKEAKRKFEIIGRKVVRPYAPRIVQVVIDFKVTG